MRLLAAHQAQRAGLMSPPSGLHLRFQGRSESRQNMSLQLKGASRGAPLQPKECFTGIWTAKAILALLPLRGRRWDPKISRQAIPHLHPLRPDTCALGFAYLSTGEVELTFITPASPSFLPQCMMAQVTSTERAQTNDERRSTLRTPKAPTLARTQKQGNSQRGFLNFG